MLAAARRWSRDIPAAQHPTHHLRRLDRRLGASNHAAPRAAPNPRRHQQLGVLLASGLIVGESLLGVVFAAAVAFSGNSYPIALVGDRF